MKKQLLITLLFFTGIMLQAQDIHWGVKFGGAITNFSYSDMPEGSLEPGSKFGFYLGGVAEYALNDQLSLAPELLLSTAGAKYESEISTDSYGYVSSSYIYLDDKMMYLDLPIIFKYYASENLSLEFGPQIGFLLSAKYDAETSTKVVDSEGNILVDESSVEDNVDAKDSLNGTDFGLSLGLGYKLESGLFFNARYNIGLSNISKDDDTYDVKNTAIQFGLGYFFN